MNPFFPVPECEYGGPVQAILAGDFNAVFLLNEPDLIPLHNLYELVWIVKKGWPRLQRILAGEEKFKFSLDKLLEGYKGNENPQTDIQLGQGTQRDESKIRNSFEQSIQELIDLKRKKKK